MNMSENKRKERTLFVFMEEVSLNLKSIGKIRTFETYESSLNSFKKFRNGKDLTLSKITSDLIIEYEAFLKAKGISKNTSSFYMRTLRAVYNSPLSVISDVRARLRIDNANLFINIGQCRDR
jgi:site-specific recombinase XerD